MRRDNQHGLKTPDLNSWNLYAFGKTSGPVVRSVQYLEPLRILRKQEAWGSGIARTTSWDVADFFECLQG